MMQTQFYAHLHFDPCLPRRNPARRWVLSLAFALPLVRPAASAIDCTIPPLPLIIALETSIVILAAPSGHFAYWRDNVRKMNNSQMWSAHPHRQVCLCTGKVHANCPYICNTYPIIYSSNGRLQKRKRRRGSLEAQVSAS